MRRAEGGFEVEIRAPTLGLITRVSPDELDPRAATVASNVRFEKGVAKNANGLTTVTPTPVLDSPANLIFQTQFFAPSENVGIVGTSRKLYTVRSPVTPDMLSLSQIYDAGSNIADVRNRFVAASFFNKVIIAQPNLPLLYWDGSGNPVALVRGLDPSLRWDGVNTFRSYVAIWRGSTFKWCATDDVFDWIPVGATATSAVFNTTDDFVMPAPGTITGWIYVNSTTASLLAIDQFMKFDFGNTTSYLNVTAVIPSTGQTGKASGFSQVVAPGTQQDVFLNSFIPYVKNGQIYFRNNSALLTVQQDAVEPVEAVAALSADFVIPPVGGTVVANLTAMPPFALGTYVSVGYGMSAGSDIYQVQSVDLTANTMELVYLGVGGTHALSHLTGEFIVSQPYVTVINTSAVAAVSAYANDVLEKYGFQGEVNDLTGVTPAGTTVPTGTQIFSVDANGAGELVNAGAIVNGPILWFDTLGDYGYILKNRSIQSVQYVGIDQGTFFIRPEVSDEGLIGKYAFVKVGLDVMYIFGNREIYRYAGGSQLVPIGRQHAVQIFSELDKSLSDKIIGYHNEKDFEIWFAFPVIGQTSGDSAYRVFIYNYVEDSCTVDDYDPSVHPGLILHGVTALGRLDLSPNLSWQDALGTWVVPLSWPLAATWQELQSSAAQNYTVAGFQLDEEVGQPTLALLNQNFARDDHAMLCQYETADFSAGDPQLMKYADTVQVALEVLDLVQQDNPYVLSIQVGSRPNLDDDIVWSNPVNLPVQGNGKYVTSVNIQRTGRYLRIRINSNQVGCGWRISRMALQGRSGAAY